MSIVKEYVSKTGNHIIINNEFCLVEKNEIKNAWEKVEEVASKLLYEKALQMEVTNDKRNTNSCVFTNNNSDNLLFNEQCKQDKN